MGSDDYADESSSDASEDGIQGAKTNAPRKDFDPGVAEDPEYFSAAPDVKSYLQRHIRTRLDRDSCKWLIARCPRPQNVPELVTPNCESFVWA